VSPRKPRKRDRRSSGSSGSSGRSAERRARLRGVVVALGAGSAVIAVVAVSAVVTAGSSTAHAFASKATSPPTVSTAPFAAPSGVDLADTPPPWALPADARPYIAAAGLSVLGAEELAVHYHTHLDIIANGAEVTVPGGIGFVVSHGQETGITVLHTHDPSGVLHIESATREPYTLGQVFTEWGVALSATQLGGLHADGTHVLAAFVNGRRFTGDPATLVLEPHLEIALWYGPSTHRPRVPKSYRFPAGL
jgi:hypothetical protein